ncbi:MAG: hypothetical protein JWP57_4488 [Spirosoma sp.]|nr:hypothetical protein [Spirosoma sp.]
MTAPGTAKRGGGRRSKGERTFVGTRIASDYKEDLGRLAKVHGMSVSEFIEETVYEKVNDFRITKPENFQEALPIGRIAS